MKSGARIRALAVLPANIDLPACDIHAILQLIGSAQVLIKTHGDSLCVGLLDQCAAHLRTRYRLSATDRSEDRVWAESNLPALVHLLIYVQAEVNDKLRDASCAAALEQCIDHLLQMHLPASEECCGRAVTSH